MEEKFNPLDPKLPPLPEILALPLNKELQKKKRKRNTGIFS